LFGTETEGSGTTGGSIDDLLGDVSVGYYIFLTQIFLVTGFRFVAGLKTRLVSENYSEKIFLRAAHIMPGGER